MTDSRVCNPMISAQSFDSVPASAVADREHRLVSIMRAEVENRRRLGQAQLSRESWVKRLLRQASVRPTRLRVALAELLFSGGDRHLTAEMLYDETVNAKLNVSLATVYNTLHEFARAGLLRQIGVDGTKLFFDTNPSAHNHFVVEGGCALFDIPEEDLVLEQLPPAPEGYTIARVDMIVRLRRIGSRSGSR